MYNSSISNDAAYAYTPQPFGNVANQFRYRPVGTSGWTNSNVSTLYYRFLKGLQSNTEYEFQVAHECSIGQWTTWSTAKTFRTLAGFAGGGVGQGKILPPAHSLEFRESMLEQTNLTIFPNPVVEVLRLESTVQFDAGSSLEIIDLQGKTISREQLTEGQSQARIDVANYAPGIYLMKYDNGYEVHIKKFMKN